MSLEAKSTPRRIDILRKGTKAPVLVQNAPENGRAYVHPILAPDGRGELTEDSPGHHPWQHGLYVGMHAVNGIDFWTEGKGAATDDGTFHPEGMGKAKVTGDIAQWSVTSEWRSSTGDPVLKEKQAWTLVDGGDHYLLDLEWSLRGVVSITFGEHAYGGLFLRMPFRREVGGTARSSEGKTNSDAEQQLSRWMAVTMVVPGRDSEAGVAMFDHPENPAHPVPWRVDGQLGIAPSRCILGDWKLGKGKTTTSRYRLFVFTGKPDIMDIEGRWRAFAAE